MRDQHRASLWLSRVIWPITAIASAVIYGCTTVSPHENFKNVMRAKLGRNANDPDLIRSNFTNLRYLISRTALPDGNVELKFDGRGTCRKIFEVNEAGTIVAWRFEGSEADCIIVP